MTRLIEGLPDDLSLRCLARVPFHLYPKLDLVSHSWLEAIRSAELFKARQEVNSTEEFICVSAYDPDKLWQLYDPRHDLWFTLPHLPTISRCRRHRAQFGTASVAGKLFVLGGTCDSVPTDEVWSYDPITRQWAPCAKMSLPPYMFACCVLDGKIIVACGLTGWYRKTFTAEIYDPEKDQWMSIPDLQVNNRILEACIGFVIGGKVHVLLHDGLYTVQVLESVEQGWTVHDCWLKEQGWPRNYYWPWGQFMTIVKEKLYIMDRNRIYKVEKDSTKVICSASEFREKIDFAMISLGDDIYVIGGVRPSEYISTSDVYVLMLGNERPVWRQVSPMTRCRGTVLGCTLLRI